MMDITCCFATKKAVFFSIKEAMSVDGLDWIISDASPWSPSESWLSENVIPSSVHVSQNERFCSSLHLMVEHKLEWHKSKMMNGLCFPNSPL